MSLRMIGSILACGVLVTGARAQSVNVIVVNPAPEPPPELVIVRERPAWASANLQGPVQTSYFIAFQNSVVRLADQYWVRDNTLYYVTADRQLMTAPLSSVDRMLSEQLNSERNVSFSLPAEQEKPRVTAILTHNPVGSVRKRCYCTYTS